MAAAICLREKRRLLADCILQIRERSVGEGERSLATGVKGHPHSKEWSLPAAGQQHNSAR